MSEPLRQLTTATIMQEDAAAMQQQANVIIALAAAVAGNAPIDRIAASLVELEVLRAVVHAQILRAVLHIVEQAKITQTVGTKLNPDITITIPGGYGCSREQPAFVSAQADGASVVVKGASPNACAAVAHASGGNTSAYAIGPRGEAHALNDSANVYAILGASAFAKTAGSQAIVTACSFGQACVSGARVTAINDYAKVEGLVAGSIVDVLTAGATGIARSAGVIVSAVPGATIRAVLGTKINGIILTEGSFERLEQTPHDLRIQIIT